MNHLLRRETSSAAIHQYDGMLPVTKAFPCRNPMSIRHAVSVSMQKHLQLMVHLARRRNLPFVQRQPFTVGWHDRLQAKMVRLKHPKHQNATGSFGIRSCIHIRYERFVVFYRHNFKGIPMNANCLR